MKKLFLAIIFFLLYGGVATTQYFNDNAKSHNAYTEPIVFTSNIVKTVDLGLDNAASDLMWLAAIQYVGGGESKNYSKLNDYLVSATNLDSKFSYPYAFGVLILPSFGYVDEGIDIGKKGVEENIRDWRVPYYLATTYFLDKNDNANAAKYFDLASRTSGAPSNIQKVAATFGSRSDQREKTKAIWSGIYESSKDEIVKERAKNYLIHFAILDLLEDAAKQYKSNYNKYPENPDDLVGAKILIAIPEDPFGFTYTFDETGRAQIK